MHQFEENCNLSTKQMHLREFRKMLGLIGDSFIAERMFHVIKQDAHSESFSLNEYLIYQDQVHHGSQREKDLISFRMLDLDNSQAVTLENYDQFFGQFVRVYGDLFHYNINFDDSSKAAETVFKKISQGKNEFSFAQF